LKILITGADGFTGTHFSLVAAAEGHQVIPLKSDLTNAQALSQEVAAVCADAVVHLAGISFVGHSDAAKFYAINTVGTANLLQALEQLATKPAKVLLASSAIVYGNNPSSPIAEDAPLAPINHYAASKAAMELLAHSYHDRLPIVIVRPFNYTGIGQADHFLIPKLVSHYVAEAPSVELGNLDIAREFNDVSFVCRAYLQLLKWGEAGQAYNICSGETYTLRSVVALLAEMSGIAMQIRVNPAFVRTNEIHRLCGRPDKLNAVFLQSNCNVPEHNLRKTLSQMLAAKRSASGTTTAGAT
jgi:nucleoside-diphosphate-sugar epimerase